MKIGDLVVEAFGRNIGLVVDLDLCNNDAFVMWETCTVWSDIKYLEVVS